MAVEPLSPAEIGDYERRRDQIAALAAGPGAAASDIEYLPSEHRTWAQASTALAELWSRHAASSLLASRERLDLPVDRVPQLSEVSDRLRRRTGFEFRAVPGLVPVTTFFGALADRVFLSTQYVRHESSPLYTPEPDVIHEVVGHAHCLGEPRLAMLHVEAGDAMLRLTTPEARQFVADVFWFSAEFGVVVGDDGPRAYGAGLLSSYGELGWFAENAELRPLDLASMGTTPYDIAHYQPLLFAARSLDEVLNVVGEFFAECTEDSIEALRASAVPPA